MRHIIISILRIFTALVCVILIGLILYTPADSDQTILYAELILSIIASLPALMLLAFLALSPDGINLLWLALLALNPFTLTVLKGAIQIYAPNKLYDKYLSGATIVSTLFVLNRFIIFPLRIR
jgi:hypothetical protein